MEPRKYDFKFKLYLEQETLNLKIQIHNLKSFRDIWWNQENINMNLEQETFDLKIQIYNLKSF